MPALPAPSAFVSVGPPLFANAPSRASATLKPHEESSARLFAPDGAVPPHELRSAAPLTIVLFSVTVEPPVG